MTNFGRTAIALTAAAVISLLIIDAAAAKSKKHHSQPAAPTENAQPAADDKQGQAKDANGQAQKPASSEKAAGAGANATPPNTWSDAEIADAKTHCAEVLQRIHAVYAAREPIREGACGAPAPIELISIGQNPEVTFSPPPIVRCDLAETLVNWLENDLQPLAKKHFGAPIIRIETMSGYSCRNAFGRKTTKLSEHGLANALDIGAFVTASAKSVSVLDDWGTTQRELVEIAEKKAAAERQAAELAAAKGRTDESRERAGGGRFRSTGSRDGFGPGGSGRGAGALNHRRWRPEGDGYAAGGIEKRHQDGSAH